MVLEFHPLVVGCLWCLHAWVLFQWFIVTLPYGFDWVRRYAVLSLLLTIHLLLFMLHCLLLTDVRAACGSSTVVGGVC